ncbi:PREDICTED: surfeit locus protein 6 homolog isoform X2 [Priapulus caudatus]|nr:PREDICTED: surfeit locus protein 6 homolog isoform X2 [Priapulus caudatus]
MTKTKKNKSKSLKAEEKVTEHPLKACDLDPLTSDTQNEVTLREKLQTYDDLFKRMLDAIPPQYYFSADVKEKLKEKKAASMDQKIKAEGLKRKNKNAITERTKQKRAKLDPEENWTITQAQEKLLGGGPVGKATLSTKQATSQEELKERLHAKISQAKASRKDDIQKREKRTLQKEKKKKKKDKSKAKASNVTSEKNGHSKDSQMSKNNELATSKKVKEGDSFTFSKFDFTDAGGKAAGRHVGRDFKRMLTKVQAQKEKVAAVRQSDPERGAVIADKHAWRSVLEKAAGAKVRNDEELLKVAVKRKEKASKQRKKRWEGRVEKVRETKEQQQKKRSTNIKLRKETKVQKKIKKAVKKGRILPELRNT